MVFDQGFKRIALEVHRVLNSEPSVYSPLSTLLCGAGKPEGETSLVHWMARDMHPDILKTMVPWRVDSMESTFHPRKH